MCKIARELLFVVAIFLLNAHLTEINSLRSVEWLNHKEKGAKVTYVIGILLG